MPRSLELLTEACAGLPATPRRMFGGHGFFAPNGGMFAGILSDDAIILKLDEAAARGELIALGGQPWVYPGRDKPITMSSWIVVPEAFYDDLELFAAWAKRALSLAPAKAAKRKRPVEPSAGKPAAQKPRPRSATGRQSAKPSAKAPARKRPQRGAKTPSR
jgi:TfoX/Sxy family transcriptional regulator of competence genes